MLVRALTGVTLIGLSVTALREAGWVRGLALAEIVAAAGWCTPPFRRFAAVALLTILAVAFVHHVLIGQFAASPFLAALIIVLDLAYDRQ